MQEFNKTDAAELVHILQKLLLLYNPAIPRHIILEDITKLAHPAQLVEWIDQLEKLYVL